ncbi:MAG: hypothetical protein IKS49_02355, partial [Actinomycetaceae bacterium]|nr:hypothetical protein [Actinomycetaceae bacterium]
MNITTMKRKPVIAVFAFFAVLAVILGGALSPLTAQATPGDPANVETWGELEDAVDSGASPITITKNLVAEGTITVNTPVTIQSGSADGVTVYSKGGRETYDSMFKVTNYGQLTIAEGVTLSGKVSDDGTANACPGANTYTADNFTGKVSDDGTTYEPKGFFIQVEQGGSATLNGTLSDFVTSRDKETTPRYVAPVVANGAGATFNIGDTGVIKNNLVGYIVNDNKANQDAQSIKQYVKGAGPNVPRVPNATKQKANPDGFGGRTRNKDAGIDAGDAGTGITATAGAVIYKGGAQGEITGAVTNNRADTGGIMVSGEGTSVTINEGTTISKNVGVQFGGGSTVEQGGEIVMWDGEMSENVAWFGGGAVYATENGVDWLQGRMSGDDKLHPQFDDRLDGRFMMFDGKLHDNTALTRGGAILVDSDAVQITKGELTNNMSRMLGGAVYVMGDHPLYTYTMSLTYLYVHDNASVSGIQEARDEAGTGPDSATLTNKWGATWDDINANLQTRLSAPNTCVDSNAPLFSGTIDQNTDDLTDGVGTDGTGGGLWLCAYGNTIFSAGATEKVVIANNYATGTVPWDNPVYNDWRNKTGPGAKKVHADADYNSASSVATATGRTGGQDIHADTGAEGKVTIDDLTAGSGWKDENASTSSIVPYVTAESDGRINLINKGTTTMGTPQVKIVGNIARHGGGLAGDGTYVLGKPGDQVSINASMQLAKSWGLSTAKKPVVIHVDAVTESGRRATVADVPLDGVPNPATEFDSVQELVPTGNTWNGKFALPLQLTPEDGGAKIPVFTLILDYEGKFDNEEIDPMSRVGKAKLIELIEALKTIHTDVNDVVDYDAVRDDLKKAVTIEFNNGLHFECTEYDEDGNPKDTYVFTHDQVDLGKAVITLQTTDVTEKVWDETEGVWKEVPVLQSHIFGMDLKLSMTNDDQPIVEKYVNKDVHADIVNFDQDFEYDVLAYVPLSATEFTLSDTLVEGLEFADKDGNPTTDPKKAIRSITVKQVNNHQPGKGGTVSSAPVREATNSLLDYMKLGGDYLPNMSINGQDLSVIFAKDNMNLHVFENPVEPHPTRPGATIQWNRDVPGRWVQLTFGARIKDEYRSIEALKELQANVDGKTTSWEGTDTNKRGTPLRTVSYENGDMGLVSALLAEVGPDQPLWIGVEKPARAGRLFAKSVNGKYFVITKADFRAWRDGDKTKQWVLLDGSIDSYDGDSWSDLRAEAEGRYNGDIPSVRNLDATSPDLSEGDQAWVDCLADHPAIVGGTIDKAAEGGTRLFAQVTDAEKNTHIYVNEDKTGAAWTELTPADSLYDTAIKRLTPDAATVRMLDLSGATFTLDEGTKNWPVVSEEEHEGMANQAAYSVKFGNNAEGTYKTNTVTVAPETTELDVVKKWTGASEEWPEGIDTVTFGIFAVKGGEEKVVYIKDGKVVGAFAEGDTIPADATPLAVELTKDDPETDVNESEATVSGLPKLKGVRYIAREIQVNGEEVTYDDTKTFGSVLTDALDVLGEMSDTFKDARFATVADALESGDRAVLGAENDDKLYVKTDAGLYYVADANGTEAPAADAWTEIAKPAAD